MMRDNNVTVTGSVEDPFGSPPARVITPNGPKRASKADSSKNWRSSSDGSSDVAPLSPSEGRGSYRLGGSDLGSVVPDLELPAGPSRLSLESAQGVYPPSSCLFVAK